MHLNFLSGFSDSVEKTLFLLIYRKCNFEGSYCPGNVKLSFIKGPIFLYCEVGQKSDIDGLLISRRKTGSKKWKLKKLVQRPG